MSWAWSISRPISTLVASLVAGSSATRRKIDRECCWSPIAARPRLSNSAARPERRLWGSDMRDTAIIARPTFRRRRGVSPPRAFAAWSGSRTPSTARAPWRLRVTERGRCAPSRRIRVIAPWAAERTGGWVASGADRCTSGPSGRDGIRIALACGGSRGSPGPGRCIPCQRMSRLTTVAGGKTGRCRWRGHPAIEDPAPRAARPTLGAGAALGLGGVACVAARTCRRTRACSSHGAWCLGSPRRPSAHLHD